MFRLVLVDDEVNVLQGIQTVFPLADRGFSVVGAFTNPVQALAELGALQPDMIITDIKMPQLSGLEFSERALDVLPDVQIVILSGYDEFEFARTAIRIGVADYLLKPVKRPDFEEMLRKVRTRIVEKQEQKNRIAEASLAAGPVGDGDQGGPWQDWIGGGLVPADLAARVGEPWMGWLGDPYLLIKVRLRRSPSGLQFDTFARCARSFFPEELRSFGRAVLFSDGEHLCVLLVQLTGDTGALKDRLGGVLNRFDTRFGISCMAAISALHRGAEDGPEAALECDSGLMSAFLSDAPVAEAEVTVAPGRGAGNGGDLEALLLAVSHSDPSGVDGVLDELFSPAGTLAGGVDYYYSMALILLVQLATLPGPPAAPGPVVSPSEASLRFLKKNYRSVSSLKGFVRSKALASMDLGAEGGKGGAGSKAVQLVVQYIGNHLAADLSLADLAAQAGVSKNYLCSVFKKETGTTLLNYLVEVRMRKAKKLLKAGGTKMYEIAEQVGYRDYAYFSQVFKKHTGTTLSEYRNSM